MTGAEAGPAQPAKVKVSVVVPVFNPGGHIDPLIRSLAEQTMPASDFETIFVDDGSTDDTPGKLDRLAASTPNVRVIHTPGSGWSGRPRNIGIDAAEGEYVQLVDHDDELGTEALERLYAYAVANGSDVVVGKEVRKGGAWHVAPLFDKNRPRATFGKDPLVGIMTPHKMFRREFLNEHHIRFFEGPRRMEDHPFVLEAFFCADVISVLSDYSVYYWHRRADRGNAGARAYEWADFYVYLRDTLDVIERYTEPGDLRDRLLAFYYDSKGLGWLTRSVPHRTPAELRKHFDALRELAQERFPPSVDIHLHGMARARSQLLRAGDFEGLVALGAVESTIGVHQELVEIEVVDDTFRVRAITGLCYGDGSPLEFQVDGGRTWWRPPIELGSPVSHDVLDFSAVHGRRRIELALRNRRSHDVHLISGDAEQMTEEAPGILPFTFDTVFEFDPETVAGGQPLEPAVYDVFVRVTCSPWRRQAPLQSLPGAPQRRPLSRGSRATHSVVPFTTPSGRVALDVDHQTLIDQEAEMNDREATSTGGNGPGPKDQAVVVEVTSSYARRSADRVRLVLHLPGAGTSDGQRARVRLQRAQSAVTGDATVTDAIGGIRVEAGLPADRLPSGTWSIAVSLGQGERFQRVQARLLTSTTRPVALLTGSAPRGSASGGSGRVAQPPKAPGHPDWMRRAGRQVDRALGVLPPAQAARCRKALRATARRVLG
jgi:glycosyltransferase involved in cell wall biosynthesis